jgi:polar amino acid transport system substrate-binding protein
MEKNMLDATSKFCFCLIMLICFSGITHAAEDTFHISTSYKSLLSNSEQTGMLDRILKEAFRRIGLQAEIVFTPTERSLADVNAGLLDAELNRIEGMEQNFPNLVRVPEPNMTMDFVAFSKHDHDVSSWESIKNLYIGVIRGWKILEENTRDFPNVTLVPTETELFTMLGKERLDIALYDKLTGYEYLKQHGFTDIRHLEPPLVSRDMFLYLHVKHSDLLDDVAEAIRSMKVDGTYQRIVSETTAHLAIGNLH